MVKKGNPGSCIYKVLEFYIDRVLIFYLNGISEFYIRGVLDPMFMKL